MPQSFNRIWIHAIWATKLREPYIHLSIEKQVYDFVADQFNRQGCPVRIINGMPDHIHCLFLLSPHKSITDIIKQVKGSSSYFINHNLLPDTSFAWQRGFAAFSVCESSLDTVFRYIKYQKEHHEKRIQKSAMVETIADRV